jgi:DNA-binding helix-hairpin-helix protein with protein kinase domain
MQETFFNSKGEIVRFGQRVGAGGEGRVYEVQDRCDLVAKVYYEMPPAEKAEKLVALTRFSAERLRGLSAWPIDVLRDRRNGRVAGFVMNRLSQAEEVHTLHSPKSRLQKFPGASWAFLIHVAANFARAVAVIHEHGLVIGDVNPKNALVTRKGTIFLLDCDSFPVSIEGKIFRCEFGMPEYTPPELQGASFRDVDRAQGHDGFGLGVVIFQLLFLGRHPFSGPYLGAGEMPLARAIREFRFAYAESREMRQPPGALALDSIPLTLIDLFRRAFLSTDRPAAREWIERLDELAKALKKCDQHSGHYYYRELSDCPWCVIESHARLSLFNFLGDNTRRGHFRLDEVWKEIASVKMPDSSLTPLEKVLTPPALSAEVAAYARNRLNRFSLSLLFSITAGLAIPLFTGFPVALFMIVLSGFVACAIGKTVWTTNVQLLFDRAAHDDPLLEKVQARWRQAEEEAGRLQVKYDREAGNERWKTHWYALQNQKGTYENLAQIRQSRLQKLEAEARKSQLGEFLEQSRGLPSKARIKIERDVAALRFRLETELSGGAHDLRRLKQEIETSHEKLWPALTEARQKLAQAEKDLEVARKRNSAVLIITALIIAFLIGWSIYLRPSPQIAPGSAIGTSREDSGSQASSNSQQAAKLLLCRRLYRKWAQLVKEKRFIEAGDTLRSAVVIDPKFGPSEDLSSMLYQMKVYGRDLSADGVILFPSFESYRGLGKTHFNAENWKGASLAFRLAIELRDQSSWGDEYTEAFYYLGLSLAKAGNLHLEIQSLESDEKFLDGAPIRRFELATFYLCAGQIDLAEKEHQLLKNVDPALAKELEKLMKKDGKPV